jgi:enoyl-CoA hydratase/carnithine racemase
VIRGEEAWRIGLVDHLAAPESLVDEAIAYAADLAENCSPTSMAVIKDQVRRALDEPLETSLASAEVLMREAFGRGDVQEGVASYLERRAPAFAPLVPSDIGGRST